MNTVDPHVFRSLTEATPDGVVICESQAGTWQATYVNPAMEQLTGYQAGAILGRNLRFLQAEDHEQAGVERLRSALRDGAPCHTAVRNYRSDGTMFWNDVTLMPLRDSCGRVTHFASFHREVGTSNGEARNDDTRGETRDPTMNTQTMLAYLRDDKLTGLARRPYFEELVRRDWGVAQRESRRLSFLLFDLDHYGQYGEVFGRQGADQSFRRIARVIGGCFRRASDVCGRFDDDQVATLISGADLSQAAKLAEAVLSRVRDLAIHHPRSNVSRYVTATASVVSMVPPHDVTPNRLYEVAQQALQDAKDLGRNRVVSRECE